MAVNKSNRRDTLKESIQSLETYQGIGSSNEFAERPGKTNFNILAASSLFLRRPTCSDFSRQLSGYTQST